jgi:hypothetical protein
VVGLFQPILRFLNRPSAIVFASVVLAIALSLNVYRIVKQYDVIGGAYDRSSMGLFDFHNGVYTPTRAFLDGVSPYGKIILDRGYPVARPSPIYGPSHFLLHGPIAILPVHVAEVVFCLLNLVMYGLIVAIPLLELRLVGKAKEGIPEGSRPAAFDQPTLPFWTLLILGVSGLLISRPGHITFVSGYFTAELVLGCIATLYFSRRKPALAGLSFVLACGKPTYALPLLIVLVILRCYRAAIWSVMIAGALTLAAVGWLLIHSSPTELVSSFQEGQAYHMADPIELPVNSWLRMDWTAIVAKWTNRDPAESIQVVVMLTLYALAFDVLRRIRKRKYADVAIDSVDQSSTISVAGSLAAISILLFVYHHVYDAMLLVPAVLAIALLPGNAWPGRLSNRLRLVLLVLLSMPYWNYFSTEVFLDRVPDSIWLRHAIASSNTIAVTVGAMLIVASRFRETVKELR